MKPIKTQQRPVFIFKPNSKRVVSEKSLLSKEQLNEREENIRRYQRLVEQGKRIFDDDN